MLQQLRIDNYKSMVNFEINFSQPLCLLMGTNGSGKSTVFDVLSLLRIFIIHGAKAEKLFPLSSLTRWQNSKIQSFELILRGNDGLYCYQLKVEHAPDLQRVRMQHEALYFDNHPLYVFSLSEEQGYLVSQAQLYRDDYSSGPLVPFDWSQSGLQHIQERADNTKLTWFKKRLQQFFIIRLNPFLMKAESKEESWYPQTDLANFADWFRYLAQDMGKIFKISAQLRELLDGFDSFKLEPAGQAKILKLKLNSCEFSFDELSDGQRALIALYTLLYCSDEPLSYTLCIDEPENYLALAEIDPWLNTLYDTLQATTTNQAIVISHHPKFINSLARDAYWLSKSSANSPTRCQMITEDEKSVGISLADLFERGWIYEQ